MSPWCFHGWVWPSDSGMSSNCPLWWVIWVWSPWEWSSLDLWMPKNIHSLLLAQFSICLSYPHYIRLSLPLYFILHLSYYFLLFPLGSVIFFPFLYPACCPLTGVLLWLMVFYLEWPKLKTDTGTQPLAGGHGNITHTKQYVDSLVNLCARTGQRGCLPGTGHSGHLWSGAYSRGKSCEGFAPDARGISASLDQHAQPPCSLTPSPKTRPDKTITKDNRT